MTHTLQFEHENTVNITYVCSVCARIIEFNKKGVGDPYAENINGEWIHPENPETWMGNCE